MAGMRPTDPTLIDIFRRATITDKEKLHIGKLLGNMPSISFDGGGTSPLIFRNSYYEAIVLAEIAQEEILEVVATNRVVKMIRPNRRVY